MFKLCFSKKGDIIFIPSGTVHAILEGIVIAEIQQNSDITYRIYDWNRVDKNGKRRELHIEKALDFIDFNMSSKLITSNNVILEGYSLTNLIKCDYFNVDEIDIEKVYNDKTNGKTFYIYMCIEGEGILTYNKYIYNVLAGQTFMIPATESEFSLEGKIKLLKIYL